MTEANVSSAEAGSVSTKERILAAAEHLFATNGFEATSLRMITSAAGVNLAAVNYHYRSKDDLIRAVYERRLRPVNRTRLERLREYLDLAGDGPIEIEPVIRAFLEPVIRLRAEMRGADLARLLGRTYVETSDTARQALFELMRDIARPFTDAFRRALPDVGPAELAWKMHFSIGVMAHTIAGTEHLKFVSGGLCDPTNGDDVLDRVVSFVAAGVRAPVPSQSNRS